VKPPETENPGGWEVKLEKTFLGGGGMDIFWNHTIWRRACKMAVKFLSKT